jgi:hypothetical protein
MAAIVIPTDTRPAVWSSPNGTRAFIPHGRKRWSSDYRPNPTTWRSAETYSARLFVGFNVGHKTVYEMSDLVSLVRQVREGQVGNPSSSFVYQHGIYRHHDGDIVEEPGAQVIIINMDVSAEQFVAQMIELAEQICSEMSQEEVVVEIQRNGIVQEVLGVNAE